MCRHFIYVAFIFVLAVGGCRRRVQEVPSARSLPTSITSPTQVADHVKNDPLKPATGTGLSKERFDGSTALTVDEVLILMSGFDHVQDVQDFLSLGERVLPAFMTLLDSSTTPEVDQSSVLGLLANMKVNHSQFMGHALARLKSKNGTLRRAAVGFLGAAGSEREAALVAVMLLDKDSTVQHAAGDALVKIGGEREVAVFDLILHNANRYEEDGLLILNQHMLDVYAKCRDELKARLKKQADEKAKTAPPTEKK